MEQKLKLEVDLVMLQAEKAPYQNHFYIDTQHNKGELRHGKPLTGVSQYLYFIDPKAVIEKDDWVIYTSSNKNNKPILLQNAFGVLGSIIGKPNFIKKYCVKVVASDNLALNLPRPNERFIQKYLYAWNYLKKPLKKAYLELYKTIPFDQNHKPDSPWIIKQRPDGTMTIYPYFYGRTEGVDMTLLNKQSAEYLYTRKDMEAAFEAGIDYQKYSGTEMAECFNDWVCKL